MTRYSCIYYVVHKNVDEIKDLNKKKETKSFLAYEIINELMALA